MMIKPRDISILGEGDGTPICRSSFDEGDPHSLSKYRLFKDHIQMVQFLKVMATGLIIAMIPTIVKLDHSKSGHFRPNFKCFFDRIIQSCLYFCLDLV